MAFIKFKEITHYFNFFKEIGTNDIPKYINDYIVDGEEIWAVYKTYRDHGVFTNEKIILFDQRGMGNIKEITTIPYKTISTFSVKFAKSTTDFYMNMYSGYPFRLRFIKLSPEGKRNLRILYNKINEKLIE